MKIFSSVRARVFAALLLSAGVVLAQQLVLIEGWDGTKPVKVQVNAVGQLVAGLACDSSLVVTLTGVGNTQIVPLSAGKRIQICHISFSGTTTDDIKLVTGTGSNCASGPVNLTGVYLSVQSIALDLAGTLLGPSGAALCVNLATAHNFGGVITYAYR